MSNPTHPASHALQQQSQLTKFFADYDPEDEDIFSTHPVDVRYRSAPWNDIIQHEPWSYKVSEEESQEQPHH
jgi:hypothetical protein